MTKSARLKGRQWAGIGRKIRLLRKARDISLQEMVDLLGMNHKNNYISYENGFSHFTPEMLIKLTEFFQIELDFLLDNSQEIIIEDHVKKSRKIIVDDSNSTNIVIDFLENINKINEEFVDSIAQIIKIHLPNKNQTTLPIPLEVIKSNVRKENTTNVVEIDKVLEKKLIEDLDLALQNPISRRKAIEVTQRFYKLLSKLNNNKKNLREEFNKKYEGAND